VRLWQLGEYQTQESQLPSLIDLDWICNLVALTVVSVGEDGHKVWAMVDLAKVRSVTILYCVEHHLTHIQ